MKNPNTVTVYSPEGEPFEMSRVNARDLVTHRKWSMSPLTGGTVAAAAPAKTEEADDASTDSEGSVEDAASTEGEAEEAAAEETHEDADEEAPEVVSRLGVKTHEAEFDHLTTREDVVAYLADFFPDFKPHHKSSRDGLIAKAIELATGE